MTFSFMGAFLKYFEVQINKIDDNFNILHMLQCIFIFANCTLVSVSAYLSHIL